MNRDFSLDLIVDGTYKSDMHLSSGKELSVRSVLESLFSIVFFKSKPSFIIMDDPFMTLDCNNFKVASKLLEEISKDKQIIYLTCLRSRELNIDSV